MSVIKVSNFTKKYGVFTAVDNISFEINKGEIVGFVGKNGAGKSTTIRSVLNFINPTCGKISVLDNDSMKDAYEIKKQVGYMPSDAMFAKNATSKQVFEFAIAFSSVEKDRIQEYANYFELDINKKISDLSLGNRKKVSIIQALLKGGEVLILDEPTSGLDPLMQDLFFKKLFEERAKGTTIFLSSHNLSEIEKYCDRAIIIKDGKIVENVDLKNRVKNSSKIITYKAENEEKYFEFNGDINELINKLSKINLTDLEIKNKSIEDEFIKYYEEEKQ